MNKLSYIRGDAALLLKEYLLWHWFGLVRRPAPPFPTCRPALFTLPRRALPRYSRTRGSRPAVGGQVTSGATEFCPTHSHSHSHLRAEPRAAARRAGAAPANASRAQPGQRQRLRQLVRHAHRRAALASRAVAQRRAARRAALSQVRPLSTRITLLSILPIALLCYTSIQ